MPSRESCGPNTSVPERQARGFTTERHRAGAGRAAPSELIKVWCRASRSAEYWWLPVLHTFVAPGWRTPMPDLRSRPYAGYGDTAHIHALLRACELEANYDVVGVGSLAWLA